MKRLFTCSALALACAAAPAAPALGTNLIVNGDAESGIAGWSGYDVYAPIQSVLYGSNWVRPDQPGPADRGLRMFTGTGAYAVAQQSVDFDAPATQAFSYALSGWLGGWAAQGDNALLFVQFLGANDAELGSASIGPVLPADRGNVTGLHRRETFGWVPVGTSRLSFWLSMERQGGGDNDGYADNLSFVMNAVPVPATALLVGLALLAMSTRRRS